MTTTQDSAADDMIKLRLLLQLDRCMHARDERSALLNQECAVLCKQLCEYANRAVRFIRSSRA